MNSKFALSPLLVLMLNELLRQELSPTVTSRELDMVPRLGLDVRFISFIGINGLALL